HPWPDTDVLLVTLRRDHVGDVRYRLAAWAEGRKSRKVIYFNNVGGIIPELTEYLPTGQVGFAFPGLAGRRDRNGVVHYDETPEQPMTLGREQPGTDLLARWFKDAGFKVSLVPDIRGWLTTHLVVVGLTLFAIAAAGSALALSSNEQAIRGLIQAQRETLRGLERQGFTLSPRMVRLLLARFPGAAARRYYQSLFRKTTGQKLAEYLADSGDEVETLGQDIQRLLGDHLPTSARRLLCRATADVDLLDAALGSAGGRPTDVLQGTAAHPVGKH
ncbi:MAG: hypothetical protein Q4D79_15510, partial [Propionibacteriaceae bacterium]|nr:hypothetical protein [Propionibacteriaceae bacterium]